jgi:hypothetical protein
MVSRIIALVLLSSLVLGLALAFREPSLALRLKPKKGRTYHFRLTVEREKPKEVGALDEDVYIVRSDAEAVVTNVTLTGMTIDGNDRSEELKKILPGPTAIMPWDALSRRTGEAKGLTFRGGGDPLIMSYLAEGGIYLGYFLEEPVKVGDKWDGSTTATGGCTGGTFKLVSIEKDVVTLDVTDIAMNGSKQIGPMTMTIDRETGLPRKLEYTAESLRTGRRSHFVQQMIDNAL